MKFKHQFSRMAYYENEWLLPDLESTYQYNFSNNYEKLEKNGWIDYDTFTYKLNGFGFRFQSIGDKNLIVIGCSFTFGIGIPFEKTWPYIVANYLGLNCLNLAVPGCSAYSAFRIAYHSLKTITPDMVLFLCPPNDRMPVLGNLSMYDIGPWVFGSNKKNYEYVNQYALEYYKEYILFEENLVLQEEMSRLALKQICNQYQIKYLDLYLKDFDFVDLGRDLSHPGILSHAKFAENVLIKL